MKMKLPLVVLMGLFIGSLALISCTTANPGYNPQLPQGPTNEPFSVDPRLLSISNQVAQIKNAVAPVNPYAGLTDYLVTGAFTLAGLVSGAVAGFKNRQAVVNTMAAGIVKAGSQAAQVVLDHASNLDNSHYTAISEAINDNTGANQTSTGAPKPTA